MGIMPELFFKRNETMKLKDYIEYIRVCMGLGILKSHDPSVPVFSYSKSLLKKVENSRV